MCAVEHVVIIGVSQMRCVERGTLYRAEPFMVNMMTARMMDSDNTDDRCFFLFLILQEISAENAGRPVY